MNKNLDNIIIRQLKIFQRNEITEYYIYNKLANIFKNKNAAKSKILKKIANEELKHYKIWKKYSKTEIKPNKFKIYFYYLISRIFGITFGMKLMENAESGAQLCYKKLIRKIPEAKKIIADEDKHEKQLIDMINEKRLTYIGSIVLGLNDALVELTGTLAGLSFALQNTKLVAVAGLITGIAASFSMAASEYLSSKAEGAKDALTSCFFTGIAYIFTVILLVLPYFIFTSYLHALLVTLGVAIFIILIFNFYISVAKDYNFKRRFTEMALISLGVATLSFGIGLAVRIFIGIDI